VIARFASRRREVWGGSPENHRITQLSHKAEAEDRAWLSGQNWPDRFGAEDTRWDRKVCVEATRSAVAGHPSDGATKTNSQSPLGGRVS
jgi:hypothetical protein